MEEMRELRDHYRKLADRRAVDNEALREGAAPYGRWLAEYALDRVDWEMRYMQPGIHTHIERVVRQEFPASSEEGELCLELQLAIHNAWKRTNEARKLTHDNLSRAELEAARGVEKLEKKLAESRDVSSG